MTYSLLSQTHMTTGLTANPSSRQACVHMIAGKVKSAFVAVKYTFSCLHPNHKHASSFPCMGGHV